MIWVAGRSPTLVSYSLRGVAMNLKATTLTYLAIYLTNPSESQLIEVPCIESFLTWKCKVFRFNTCGLGLRKPGEYPGEEWLGSAFGCRDAGVGDKWSRLSPFPQCDPGS
jgi:hypothetical protein